MRSLALVAGIFALAGCGGSSSETPFPIEPNRAELERGGPLRQARYVVLGGAPPDADGGIIEREQIADEPLPSTPVRSTWGGEAAPVEPSAPARPAPEPAEE